MSDADPVWARVQRRGPDECWPWTGSCGQGGQPHGWIGGRSVGSVRRYVYELASGIAITRKSHQVGTSCGMVTCLNPKHLTLKPYGDIEARFWIKVDKNGPTLVPELGPCWLWTGAPFRNGYGAFRMHGKIRHAARVSYEFANGPIVGHVAGDAEREIVVMHRCDNPPCVRPDHLELGTDKDNIADMWRKGRGSRGEKHAVAVKTAAALRLSTEGGGK